VAGLIQRLGKEKGFAVVVERQRAGVLYASVDADLTDDVLRAYDDQTKKATK
jgi:Skp family chaperone for outer membrane proteins